MQQDIFVLIYSTNEFQTINFGSRANAESICFDICKDLKITPAYSPLFGLRIHNVGAFVAPSQPVVAGERYEFRLRFQVNDLKEMKSKGGFAHDYLYWQIKSDLIALSIRGLEYPNLKDQVAGLCVTIMYVDKLEKELSPEQLMSNYRKYVPAKYVKEHSFFIKSILAKKLKETIKGEFASE